MARGPVVSTDALLAELTSGRLRAAMDVTDPEPLPPDHPLWRAPNVLISPHVGGDTTAFPPRARALLRDQLHPAGRGPAAAQRGTPAPLIQLCCVGHRAGLAGRGDRTAEVGRDRRAEPPSGMRRAGTRPTRPSRQSAWRLSV